MKRYELPQPPAGKMTDVAAWQECVDNSQAQLEHQALRILNLELMADFGVPGWKAYNEILVSMIEKAQKQLQVWVFFFFSFCCREVCFTFAVFLISLYHFHLPDIRWDKFGCYSLWNALPPSFCKSITFLELKFSNSRNTFSSWWLSLPLT